MQGTGNHWSNLRGDLCIASEEPNAEMQVLRFQLHDDLTQPSVKDEATASNQHCYDGSAT